MLKEILLNGWFYNFIIGWILFFMLIDWSSLKRNVWAGIFTSILELWQDATAVHLGMYRINDAGIWLFGTSVFFTFGLAFTMGVLFMQYLPDNNKLQLVHILVFSAGFVIFEIILIRSGYLVLLHWNSTASFFDNTIIMGSLAWLRQLVLYASKPKMR